MKKILIIYFVLFYPIEIFSAINEYKTDVYFANGILTSPRSAIYNANEVLKPEIISLYSSLEDYNKHIGEVGYSYNATTESTLGDGLESMLQKFDWDGLLDYFSPSHLTDVKRHVEKYKNSILAGHRVLVVAHS